MYRKVSVKELRVDMFIAELDRPWSDTPFPLQGFLIDEVEHIQQLREFCSWVVVDTSRSIGREFEAPPVQRPPERRDLGKSPTVLVNRVQTPSPAAASGAAPATSRPRPQSREPGSGKKSGDSASAKAAGTRPFAVHTRSISTDPANHAPGGLTPAPQRRSARAPAQGWELRGLLSQLKDSARNIFSAKAKDGLDFDRVPDATSYPQPGPDERPGFLPESVVLTIYEDKHTVQEELTFAADTYARTNEILSLVADDIRAGHTLQLDSLEDVIDDMVESMVRNPDAMMWVARMRELDVDIYDHGLTAAISLVAFGRHIGYPKEPLSHLGMLGLLLDVGKMKLPRNVLEKSGPLTKEEFALVKTHVELGLNELHRTPNIHADVLEGIAQHHERMNGGGYPNGLQGEKISIFGRMAGIADTYSAMTRKRAYAEAVSPHEALQLLSNWSGTQFHPDMVEQFIQSIGAFPVGSLVELSTGEVAVIVTHNKQKRLKPKVLVISEPDKTARKYPTTLDLIYDVSDRPVYIRRGLPNDAFGLDPSEYYLN